MVKIITQEYDYPPAGGCELHMIPLKINNYNQMKETIAQLKRGEKGIIENYSTDVVPVKLQELGCLPGSEVQLIQLSPFNDLMYLNISGSYFAIRTETAALIEIAKVG